MATQKTKEMAIINYILACEILVLEYLYRGLLLTRHRGESQREI